MQRVRKQTAMKTQTIIPNTETSDYKSTFIDTKGGILACRYRKDRKVIRLAIRINEFLAKTLLSHRSPLCKNTNQGWQTEANY